MKKVADVAKGIVEQSFVGFIAGSGPLRVRLLTREAEGVTVAEMKRLEEVLVSGEPSGATALQEKAPASLPPPVPLSLSEARAMLAEFWSEHLELAVHLESTRRALQDLGERHRKDGEAHRRRAEHGEVARRALADVLALFLPDRSGWARSVSVTLDDLDGWHRAAQPWPGTNDS